MDTTTLSSVAKPVKKTSVAALIPAYREAAHISDVVTRTLPHVDLVLVVDDGSPDDTAAVAEKAGAAVIRHQQNKGKGGAIKTGLTELHKQGFDYVVLLDADGQHRPEEIPAFIRQMGELPDAAMLVGNRMSDTRTMPLVRKLTNRTMSGIISLLCRQRIPDTQCGFRLMHQMIVPLVLACETKAFDFETEMLFAVGNEGYTIGNVPISTVYGDEVSKIRPVRDTIKFIKLVLRHLF